MDWAGHGVAVHRHGDPRRPLKREFTAALSKVSPNHMSKLAKTLCQVRESVDVILPMKNRPAVRRYVAKHRPALSRVQRSNKIKQARNAECAKAAGEFVQKKSSITERHITDRAAVCAERIMIKAEANQAWSDYRQEHKMPGA